MQKKFYFWYRLFGFTLLNTKVFFETKLPVILQISKFASQELKIDFLKLRIFAQALDILRKRKKTIYFKHFRQRFFYLIHFFVFSIT